MRVAAFLLLWLVVTVSFYFRYSPYLFSHVFRLAVACLAAGLAVPIARFVSVRAVARSAWRVFVDGGSRTALVLSLLAFGACLAVSRGVLDPFPHIPDEFSYWFQARIFASGRLYLPSSPIRDFVPADWVVDYGGKWFSVFPPGWPLLLSLGLRIGAPTLVNPILGALSVLAIHRLATHFVSEARALAAAGLCVVSPFFVFMGSSLMSHPASLLFSTLSLLFLLEATERRDHARFALSGAFAGSSFLVRPLEATVLWIAANGCLALRHRSARQWAGSGLSGLGLGLGMVSYLAYNHQLTGEWFLPPLSLTSQQNRFGFGPDIGLEWSGFPSPGHDLWRGALNANYNLAVLSADLFGWPISSLWPVLALVCFGKLDSRHRLCLLLTLALVAAYLPYWYHGVCFGARFYFAALPFLLILTVEGLAQAPDVLGRWLRGGREHAAALVAAFVALCFAYSALVYVPVLSLFTPYHNQRQIDSGLARFVADESVESGIVFVGPTIHDYAPGFIANALDPTQGDILYALESGARDAELERRFPDRKVYHYTARAAERPYPVWVRRWLFGGWLGLRAHPPNGG